MNIKNIYRGFGLSVTHAFAGGHQVGGITVLLEILRHYGQDALVVSDGGLRLGLLAELAAAS